MELSLQVCLEANGNSWGRALWQNEKHPIKTSLVIKYLRVAGPHCAVVEGGGSDCGGNGGEDGGGCSEGSAVM